MADRMNIYTLSARFWEENRYEPFSTAAIALFFFLIDRVNRRRWQMPVTCATTVISREIHTSRQTVLAARKALAARGFISFKEGLGRESVAEYAIIDVGNLPVDLTVNDTVTLSENASVTESVTESVGLSLNNKKDIRNNISSNNNHTPVEKFRIEDLHERFLADTEWLESISSLLSRSAKLTVDDVKARLAEFFIEQKLQGRNEREEADCRQHFINWLKKNLKNQSKSSSNYGIPKQTNSERRGSDVTATSYRDYGGSF